MIKAETKPSKIVPAAQSKDPKSGKLIYDRVNSSGQSEKIVSREEQPVDIKDKPVGAVLPQAQSGASGGAMRQSALGSGVVGVEPKKIHTIAIRPNQVAGAASAQPPAADAGAHAGARPGTRPAGCAAETAAGSRRTGAASGRANPSAGTPRSGSAAEQRPAIAQPQCVRAGPDRAKQRADGGGGATDSDRAHQERCARACRARQDRGAGSDRPRGERRRLCRSDRLAPQ